MTFFDLTALADVVVIDNRRVWHRSSPSLAEPGARSDDALMTIRLKYFPPTAAS